MYIVHNNIIDIELNFPDKKEEYKSMEYKQTKKLYTSEYYGVSFLKHLNKYCTKIKIKRYNKNYYSNL